MSDDFEVALRRLLRDRGRVDPAAIERVTGTIAALPTRSRSRSSEALRAAAILLTIGALVLIIPRGVPVGGPDTATPPVATLRPAASPGAPEPTATPTRRVPPEPSPVLPDPVGPDGELVFIDYPGIPWRDQSGNTVSWTVISAIQGPGHCNWEAAAFISIGWPFGHSASTVADSRRYVRDPDHVLPAHWPFATTYDPSVTLPSDARDTGYRYGDAELWYSPSTVDREIYLVRGSTAERLPRDPEGLGCA